MKKRIANSIITTLKSMDGRRINGARKVVAGYVRSARNILPDSFSCIGFQSFRCSFQQKRESCSLKRYCTTSVQSIHYHINPKINNVTVVPNLAGLQAASSVRRTGDAKVRRRELRMARVSLGTGTLSYSNTYFLCIPK